MSDNNDFSVMGNTFNNPNGNETATTDALSAVLRIGTMVFSSWLRSLVSKLFFKVIIRNTFRYFGSFSTYYLPRQIFLTNPKI